MIPLSRFDVDPMDDEVSASHARLLLQRPRASAEAILLNPFATIDHIPLIQCVCGNDSHFAEVQQIPRSLQGKWAECFSLVATYLLDVSTTATTTPRP